MSVGITVCITMMSQKRGWINENQINSVNLITWYIKQQTCFAGHTQGSTFEQHSVQSRPVWETPLNHTFQYSNLQSQNWTESYEEIKNDMETV